MPAPFTIVTFYDADGDEFPIRIQGTEHYRAKVIEAARFIFTEFIERGEMRPVEPFDADVKVEQFG